MTVRSTIIVLSIWLQLNSPRLAWAGGCGDAFGALPLVVQVLHSPGGERELVVGESLTEQLQSLAQQPVDAELRLDLDGATVISLLGQWRLQDSPEGQEIQKRLSAMETKAVRNIYGVRDLSVITGNVSPHGLTARVDPRVTKIPGPDVRWVLVIVENYFFNLKAGVLHALATLNKMDPQEVYGLAAAGEGPLFDQWMALPQVQAFIASNGLYGAEHVQSIFRALAYAYAADTLTEGQSKFMAAILTYGALDTATDPVNVPLRLRHLEENITSYDFASEPVKSVHDFEILPTLLQQALRRFYREAVQTQVITVSHQVPYHGPRPDLNFTNLVVYRIRWTQVTVMVPAMGDTPARLHHLNFFEFLGFDEEQTSPEYRIDTLVREGYLTEDVRSP